jgi:BA14K-like protein
MRRGMGGRMYRGNWGGQRYFGNYRRPGWNYHNGYRGYRYYRPGYRHYDGWWYPAAAFVAGALITGAIVNQQQRVYSGNAHVNWCYSRYRSYRAYDNTYQPYYGPRRQCYSPY